MRLLEIFADLFSQNGWSEGAKGLPLLNALIQNVLHISATRIDDNRSIAERPRPELQTPLKPSHHCSAGDIARGPFRDVPIRGCLKFQIRHLQLRNYLVIAELRAEAGAFQNFAARLL